VKKKIRKPGFSIKAPQRQELFIRADSFEDARAEYCSRTGAKLSEFELKKTALPIEKKEPESVEELVEELEADGFEITTLGAELIPKEEALD